MRDYRPKVIILSGDGINCERETQMAFKHSGANASIVHINDLLKLPSLLKSFDIMAIPGGFSFGDELGSGKLLALKIKHGLMKEFNDFIKRKRPIIGICNGFQVLVKIGLLNSNIENKSYTLSHNSDGNFIDCWVTLELEQKSMCKWLDKNDLNEFLLPIRHGEGRLMTKEIWETEILSDLNKNGNIVLRYREDINGSLDRIAGLCSDDGLIFGLMPHPEAAFFKLTENLNQIPVNDSLEFGVGVNFFKPIIEYVKEEKRV